MAALKTYTFKGNTEESLVFSVLRTLTAHSECLGQEVRLHIESWLEPYSYWPVEKTVCFPLFCFSDCDDHICSLSFLFHRDLVYKGPRDCRISTQMTEDRTPRELAGSAPWGAKGGVFGAAASPHQWLRLRNCDQDWKGAGLFWGNSRNTHVVFLMESKHLHSSSPHRSSPVL